MNKREPMWATKYEGTLHQVWRYYPEGRDSDGDSRYVIRIQKLSTGWWVSFFAHPSHSEAADHREYPLNMSLEDVRAASLVEWRMCVKKDQP